MYVLVLNAQDYLNEGFASFSPKVFTYQHKQAVGLSIPNNCAIIHMNTLEELKVFNTKLKEKGNRYYWGLIIEFAGEDLALYQDTPYTDDWVCAEKEELLRLINQCQLSIYIYDNYIE